MTWVIDGLSIWFPLAYSLPIWLFTIYLNLSLILLEDGILFLSRQDFRLYWDNIDRVKRSKHGNAREGHQSSQRKREQKEKAEEGGESESLVENFTPAYRNLNVPVKACNDIVKLKETVVFLSFSQKSRYWHFFLFYKPTIYLFILYSFLNRTNSHLCLKQKTSRSKPCHFI